jgi:DNA replication protein DnaC
VERVIHALLKAEIAAKQARSIIYQLGVAKMPLAKELTDLSFEGTPINGELIKQLASGAFLDDMRNIVLVGGTGTGKSHIAIGIARSIIRAEPTEYGLRLGFKGRMQPSSRTSCPGRLEVSSREGLAR